MSDDMIEEFEREQIIATHEAGHAVISYVLGYDFELITIEPNETLGSDSAFQRSPLKEARENSNLTEDGKKHWMLDKITITLSGGLAVYQLTNNRKALGMGPDLNSAWGLARMLVKDGEKVAELNTALASRVGGCHLRGSPAAHLARLPQNLHQQPARRRRQPGQRPEADGLVDPITTSNYDRRSDEIKRRAGGKNWKGKKKG